MKRVWANALLNNARIKTNPIDFKTSSFLIWSWPNFTKAEEEAVFDFAAEANILKNVSDNTYNNLVSILNETAAIDIVGICGYYSLISMTLNVFKVPNDTDKWPLPEVKDFSKMLKS